MTIESMFIRAKRQAIPMALVVCVAVLLGWLWVAKTNDVFTSSVTISYNAADASGPATRSWAMARFPQMAATLKRKFRDSEFLWNIAVLSDLEWTEFGGQPLVEDVKTKAKVAALLSESFVLTADREAQVLTLNVYFRDPIGAKRLADVAQEQLISSELRHQAEMAQRQYDAYRKFLAEAKGVAVGPPKPEAASEDDAPQMQEVDSQFLERLQERVDSLDLERKQLVLQLHQVDERTRLRVAIPASYNEKPVQRTKVRVGLLMAGLGFFLAIGVGVFLDAQARDSSEANMAQLPFPVLATIPKAVVQSLCESDVPSSEALDCLTGIFSEMQKVAVGQVWVQCMDLGPQYSRSLFHRLATIAAKSSERPVLAIEGSTLAPVGNSEDHGRPNLEDFFAGKAPWKAVRSTRSRRRSYDLVMARKLYETPMAPPVDEPSKGAAAALVEKLFASLTKGYQKVLLRAVIDPEDLLVEQWVAAASDGFLWIDSRKFESKGLKTEVASSAAKAIRGVILVKAS